MDHIMDFLLAIISHPGAHLHSCNILYQTRLVLLLKAQQHRITYYYSGSKRRKILEVDRCAPAQIQAAPNFKYLIFYKISQPKNFSEVTL